MYIFHHPQQLIAVHSRQRAGLTLIPRYERSLVSKNREVEQSQMNTVNVCFYWEQTERTSSIPYASRGQKAVTFDKGKREHHAKMANTYT